MKFSKLNLFNKTLALVILSSLLGLLSHNPDINSKSAIYAGLKNKNFKSIGENEIDGLPLYKNKITGNKLKKHFSHITILKNENSQKTIVYTLLAKKGNIRFDMNPKNESLVDLISINNTTIKDAYNLKIGMDFKEVFKKRKNIQISSFENIHYAYVPNSRVKYEIVKLEYNKYDNEKYNWKIKRILWERNPIK